MSVSRTHVLAVCLRLGFGVLLIVASVDKILHPVAFAQAVENYLVFGEGISRWAAVWIPYLEAVTGVFLVAGIWIDAAVLVNVFLMISFLLMVLQARIRGLDIYCGCFAVEGENTGIGILKIMENTAYAGLSILLVMVTQKTRKIKTAPQE